MKAIIIYGSEYGTTKKYAEKLSELTSIEAISFENIPANNEYELIVCMGGLYAGGVKGLKRVKKILSNDMNLIIVTVGLADPMIQSNTDHIKEAIQKQISPEQYDGAKIFHLRGGIDYSKLGFAHKAMMSLLVKKVRQIDEDKQTSEMKAMLETYNKDISFVDYESLTPIVEEINKR